MSEMFSAMDVSASALSANRQRMELIINNIANSQTTRTPEGGPYRRKDVVFMSTPMESFSEVFLEIAGESAKLEGVRVAEVTVSAREPVLRYQPNHPDADENGYVAYPDINPIEEMANLIGASRSYEANVKAFEAVKRIIERSIEMGRRG